ncbi:MAG: NADP-dependent oxidoreductase [Corynebacterium sp.]|nr:NADP-dependent oxidoreductase [Corynebacterium sp.]
MQSIQLQKYGEPLRFVDTQRPTPMPNEVLVRVEYSGLNHGDERLRAGEFKAVAHFDLPMIIGSEFSGKIVETGSQVTDWRIGEKVYAHVQLERSGAWAEYVPIPATLISKIPETIDLKLAAGLPVNALTAWQALTTIGRVQTDDVVLIQGGAGSVGLLAVELALHLGAKVVTTASAKDRQRLEELGVSRVIDYRTEDFVEVAKQEDIHPTFVLDTQGEKTLLGAMQIVAPGATVVGISGPPDIDFARSLGAKKPVQWIIKTLSYRVRRAAKKAGAHYTFFFVSPNGQDLSEITKLVDAGILYPHQGTEVKFSEIPQALADLTGGALRGKILAKHSL